MKIIVFSDSHGDVKALSSALKKHHDGVDAFVFLGDGTDDAEYVLSDYPTLPRIIVAGNREDHMSAFLSAHVPPREATFEAEGVRFLALHGHRPSDVKRGLDALAVYAAEMGVDVVLYGHTHKKSESVVEVGKKTVRMINPGSAGQGTDRSFALLNVIDGNVVCGFGKI